MTRAAGGAPRRRRGVPSVAPRQRRAAEGFTLVEVMIAIAITAILGMLTFGTFRQLDRAMGLVRGDTERYAAAEAALSRFAREVSMAFLSDHFDPNQYREAPTLFRGREDTVLFTTMAHVRLYTDARESDEEVVEYGLDSDPEHPGQQALFRREKPRIDADPERGGRRDVVADRVTALRLSYWDPKRKEWVREWSTRSTDHPKELPDRVRIELDLSLPDGRTEKLSTEARPAIARALDF